MQADGPILATAFGCGAYASDDTVLPRVEIRQPLHERPASIGHGDGCSREFVS